MWITLVLIMHTKYIYIYAWKIVVGLNFSRNFQLNFDPASMETDVIMVWENIFIEKICLFDATHTTLVKKQISEIQFP